MNPEENKNTESEGPLDDQASEEVFQAVEQLADEFLEQLRTGGEANRQAFVASHPELEPELSERLKLVETVFWATRLKPASSEEVQAEKLLSEQETPRESFPDDDIDETLKSPPPSSASSRRGSKTSSGFFQRDATVRIRCPHCGNLVHLVAPDLHEVSCDSCGSAVHLDRGKGRHKYSPPMPAKIGRFKVIRTLGRGAFGTVYLADDIQLNRQVAVKVPRQGFFLTDAEEERFFREARSAATLKHPNIVQVYEISEDPAEPYIVTEFIEGPTLSDLADSGLLIFSESATLMVQIANAVEFAHSKGIIHRDLKPSNILIDDDRKAYVADFGLARREDAEITVTLDGVILGTPAYMSPEQARGLHEKVDARSDIYSLGVIFYRLLCQQAPFTGTKRTLLHQVINDEPKSPKRLNDQVPTDLETITLRAMSKTRERRFQSAGDLSQELQRWLRKEPIRSRPISQFSRLTSWCKRNPTVSWLAGLSAALLLLIASLGFSNAVIQARLKKTADENFVAALESRKESDARLVGLMTINGQRALESNELIRSSFWHTNAVTSSENGEPSDLDRLQIGMIQDRQPKLTGLLNPEGNVSQIKFSRDASKLAVLVEPEVAIDNEDGGSLVVFDRLSGESIFRKDSVSRFGGVQFFDNDRKVVFSNLQQDVQAWNLETNAKAFDVSVKRGGAPLSVSEDGKSILVGSDDGKVHLVDGTTGESKKQLEFENTRVLRAEFPPGKNNLAIVVSNPENSLINKLHVWDVDQDDAQSTHEHSKPFRLAYSSNGTKVATITLEEQSTLSVWETETGNSIVEETNVGSPARRLFFNQDGSGVIVLDRLGRAELWLLAESPKLTDSYQLSPSPITFESTDSQKLLAIGDNTQNVRVLWLDSGLEVCSKIPSSKQSGCLAFSPDDREIAIEGNNGLIHTWDLAGAATSQFELTHDGNVLGSQFALDDSRCVTIGDSTARIWDSKTGEQVGAACEHEVSILSLDVSDDGKFFATGDVDGTVKVWSAESGQQVGKILKHESVVRVIQISPDGKRVATGTDAGDVQVWNIEQLGNDVELKPLFTTKLNSRIRRLAFDLESKVVLSASILGDVRCWNAENGNAVFGPFDAEDTVMDASFSEDEDFILVTAGRNLLVWDKVEGKLLGQSSSQNRLARILVLQNGDVDVSDWEGGVTRINISDGKVAEQGRLTLGSLASCLALARSSDDLIALAGTKSDYYEGTPDSGVVQVTIEGGFGAVSPPLNLRGAVTSVAFNRDSTQLLASGRDQSSILVRLVRTELPARDVIRMANLYVGSEIDSEDQVGEMTAEKQLSEFVDLKKTYPGYFKSDANEITAWASHLRRFERDADGEE